MDELLASIRKAIHDDIGEVPASMSSRASGTLQRGETRELHVKVGEEAASAAVEIQMLREKMGRSRSDTLPPRDVAAQRPTLAEALQSETPRRAWRDIEAQPRLRPSLLEAEYAPPPRVEHRPRVEVQPEPVPHWHEEPAALPPPRDSFRPRADAASILSGEASQAVNSAFNRLAETVLSRATGDRSLEDMTRELLRGMLKQWLDDHLPALVEKLVREEIERVARNGR
jgi:uncharacterized protein